MGAFRILPSVLKHVGKRVPGGGDCGMTGTRQCEASQLTQVRAIPQTGGYGGPWA